MKNDHEAGHAEVHKLLKKRNPTVGDQVKIQAAYNCLNALLGPERVKHLYDLVEKEENA